MLETDKQTKYSRIDKLCPSERDFPFQPNPLKKCFPGDRIVFYQSENEMVYLKFPKTTWFLAKLQGNRINFRQTELVLMSISGTYYSFTF